MVEFTLYQIKKDGSAASVVADQEGKIQCILPLSGSLNYQYRPKYSNISAGEGQAWLALPAEKESDAPLAFAATLLDTKPLSQDISQKISDYYQDAVKQIGMEYERRDNGARVTEEYYDPRIKMLKEEKEKEIKKLIVCSDQAIQQLEPVCRLEELVKKVS